MNYEQMLEYLYGLKIFGMKLGLERIEKALKIFGNPHKDLKCIHVTGSNGKGSVVAMVTSILKFAGYKAGMFTSPHLVDLRERIRINDELISKEDLLKVFNECYERLRKANLELTYFEFLTLIAFVYFKEKKVDYAVLEVGLGGTYDSTNVVNSIVSVITNVSLEHTDVLGDSIEKIAKDKAGIIKPNSFVVTSSDDPVVLKIIKEKAKEKNCNLVIAEKVVYPLSLRGEFQKLNAGCACEVCSYLGIDEKYIKEGLKKTQWPGRLQFLEKNILLDAAHNPAAIKVLREYLNTLKYKSLIVLFSISGKRDYKVMLKELEPYDVLIFTKSHIWKAIDPDTVDIDCIKIKDPVEAFDYAKSMAKTGDLVLITGSVYLVGNILEFVTNKEILVKYESMNF